MVAELVFYERLYGVDFSTGLSCLYLTRHVECPGLMLYLSPEKDAFLCHQTMIHAR